MNHQLRWIIIGLPLSFMGLNEVALGNSPAPQIENAALENRHPLKPVFKPNQKIFNPQVITTATEPESENPQEEIQVEFCPFPMDYPATPQLIEIQINSQGNVIQNNSSILSAEDLEAEIQRILKQKDLISESFKKKLEEYITNQYINRGLITSSAEIIEITSELILIQVTEGTLTTIQLEGRNRLNQSYICDRIFLGITTPFNQVKLEDQLRLLRSEPLFKNVTASLRPTGKLGQTKLVVRVEEAQPFSIRFSLDNYSPPSIGSEQLGVGVRYLNLTGTGDQIAASYQRSTTGGADILDFYYGIPINAMNGTIQLRVSPYWTEITQAPFNQLDIRGQTDRYELSYHQPLIRSSREELALSVGFTYQEGQTFIFDERPFPFLEGPDENGVSRTSVLKFAQEYINRNPVGSWILRSEFAIGTGLFDATRNSGSTPDGQFFKWLAQAQRVQQLNNHLLLILQAELQLSTDGLLPAQQFILGGGQSLRGFRQNLRAGDNGFRLSIENRWTLTRNSVGAPIFQIAPFLDLGAVWNLPDNPNLLADETVLAGAGLGLLWRNAFGLIGLSLQLDYGLPLIEIDDRGNNIQDDGLYFRVNYQPQF